VSSLENLDHSSAFSNSWCSFLPASICWLRSVFSLCPLALVLRVQTGAAKCLRGPLAASALDLATVPASPHTQRGPEHSLGRNRLGLERASGFQKTTNRYVCSL
jgi:hypothetical protein